MSKQIQSMVLGVMLSLVLLLSPIPGIAPVAHYVAADTPPIVPLRENLQGIPGAGTDWWAAAQEKIRQSEYQVTWQERTYLPGLATAYQAPNRAHNLRTYFTPQGIRVIPRIFESETPPWEWSLALSGTGYADDVQPVPAANLHSKGNRIEYRRELLTEWYVNDERGLEQGFTLFSPPRTANPGSQSAIVLELVLSGDLTASLSGDGQAIELTTRDRVQVLRYGDLAVTDAAGRTLPAHLEVVTHHTLRITLDATHAVYPITVAPTITGLSTDPAWTAYGDQDWAWFGNSVGTAGDVNGDGYSDVIVGAVWYDNGQSDEGRAYVYHGSAAGLATDPAWMAEGDQADAYLGISAGTAGDVNGDGYADVIVGAYGYSSGQMGEGRAIVYHGGPSGLMAVPAWTTQSDQEAAHLGYSVGTAGDVNADGYADVIVGAPGYTAGQDSEGWAAVYHGSATGLATDPAWMVESDENYAYLGISVGTAGDVNGDGYADVIVGADGYTWNYVGEGWAAVYHGSAAGLTPGPVWTGKGGQDGAAFGTSVGTAGDVNGDGYADVIVGARQYDDGEVDQGRASVYHGSAAGLGAAPAWTAEGNQGGARFGSSVGTAGDANGDGYADVIVGAVLYDNDQADAGQATVYSGSQAGLASIPAWIVEGDQTMAQLGASVGTAGDVNGDGYSDIIVGAPDYDNDQTSEGRATVYHGGPSGLTTVPAWTAEGDQEGAHFGFSVGTAGDVNGDGYSDVIVGADGYDNGQTDEGRAYVYHGSATGLEVLPAWTAEGDQDFALFGFSVGTAGDVNGDGYGDVIVGATGYDHDQTDEGRASVYHGSAMGLGAAPAWTAESDQVDANFGMSVGTAGDVNGDGYGDVVVGAGGYDHGQTDEGRAYAYHGSAIGLATDPAWTAESNQAGAYFGLPVGTAGDVNGDGYSDVIVGAIRYDHDQADEGRAFVYHGSATGLGTDPAWTAESDQAGARFGVSVGTAGDVNGDGYSDVIVGADYYANGQTDEGRAYVYHGGAGGLSTTPAWTAESDQADARLGFSAETAGDVTGDGYSDVIVGAYNYDNDQMMEGRAFVYHGGATGLSADPDWTGESDQVAAQFGVSVGTAGDVNGDGYSDVIVGACFYDNGQVMEGRAYVYYGNDGDGLHLLPRQMRADGSAPIAFLGMSDSRTAFQLRLIGRMPLGREDVRLQWQVAPLGTPITTTGVISGVSGWTDVLTTGVVISQDVTGLAPGTPYHWRVRLLYSPGNVLGQPAGRWVHIPWNGWNETDLRTMQAYHLYLPLVVR